MSIRLLEETLARLDEETNSHTAKLNKDIIYPTVLGFILQPNYSAIALSIAIKFLVQ